MHKDFYYETGVIDKTLVCFRRRYADLSLILTKELRLTPNKCLMVTDSNIPKTLILKIKRDLQKVGFEIFIYSFDRRILDDERIKSNESAQLIYEVLLKNGFDRSCLIIAIGGGVIGDLVGFCAASFHRGIPLVQYPTSLLAQVDSSIGGKNAVHFNGITNLIGMYYQPKLIYIDISVLKSLPKREYLNGLVEIIKIALIADKSLALFIDKHIVEIKKYKKNILYEIIYRAAKLKMDIVSRDLKENNERLVLNYGHTAGQAIETIFKHTEIRHGEAVLFGIIVATKIGIMLNITKNSYIDFQEKLLDKFGYLSSIATKLNLDKSDIKNMTEKIYRLIVFDKKKYGKKQRFIIPLDLGESKIIMTDDANIIKTAIRDTLEIFAQ